MFKIGSANKSSSASQSKKISSTASLKANVSAAGITFVGFRDLLDDQERRLGENLFD